MRETTGTVNRREGDKPLTQDPQRLWRRRMEAGLTLRQLAEKAHVGHGSISDLERGKQSARVTMLAALARALECEIADLMPQEPAA